MRYDNQERGCSPSPRAACKMIGESGTLPGP